MVIMRPVRGDTALICGEEGAVKRNVAKPIVACERLHIGGESGIVAEIAADIHEHQSGTLGGNLATELLQNEAFNLDGFRIAGRRTFLNGTLRQRPETPLERHEALDNSVETLTQPLRSEELALAAHNAAAAELIFDEPFLSRDEGFKVGGRFPHQLSILDSEKRTDPHGRTIAQNSGLVAHDGPAEEIIADQRQNVPGPVALGIMFPHKKVLPHAVIRDAEIEHFPGAAPRVGVQPLFQELRGCALEGYLEGLDYGVTEQGDARNAGIGIDTPFGISKSGGIRADTYRKVTGVPMVTGPRPFHARNVFSAEHRIRLQEENVVAGMPGRIQLRDTFDCCQGGDQNNCPGGRKPASLETESKKERTDESKRADDQRQKDCVGQGIASEEPGFLGTMSQECDQDDYANCGHGNAELPSCPTVNGVGSCVVAHGFLNLARLQVCQGAG